MVKPGHIKADKDSAFMCETLQLLLQLEGVKINYWMELEFLTLSGFIKQ